MPHLFNFVFGYLLHNDFRFVCLFNSSPIVFIVCLFLFSNCFDTILLLRARLITLCLEMKMDPIGCVLTITLCNMLLFRRSHRMARDRHHQRLLPKKKKEIQKICFNFKEINPEKRFTSPSI